MRFSHFICNHIPIDVHSGSYIGVTHQLLLDCDAIADCIKPTPVAIGRNAQIIDAGSGTTEHGSAQRDILLPSVALRKTDLVLVTRTEVCAEVLPTVPGAILRKTSQLHCGTKVCVFVTVARYRDWRAGTFFADFSFFGSHGWADFI